MTGGDYSHATVTDPAMVAGMAEAAGSPPAPSVPSKGPVDWVRKNLFSSVGNSIITVLFLLIGYFILRWLLDLVFSEERNWASVWTNIRLLFAYNYPAEQFGRIWFSLGAVLVGVGITLASLDNKLTISLRKILSTSAATGGFLLLLAVLASAAGDGARLGLGIAGIVLLGVGLGLGRVMGLDEENDRRLPILGLLGTIGAAVIGFVWLVPFGRYESVGAEVTQESGTVASSTQIPWTIMMVLLVASYPLGLALKQFLGGRSLRGALGVWWVFGPAFLVFLVLRDPTFDWAHVWSTDIPMGLAFAFIGGAILFYLSKPGNAGIARIVGAVLLAYAAFNWIAAFGDISIPGLGTINFQWYPWQSMLQKARISFLLLALVSMLAATFAGEVRARLRFAGAWAGFMLLFHWLVTGINTESTLQIVSPPFLGGFTLTVVIAYYTMLLSFPIGMLMALARTSKLPIFRVLATGYIEFVRGVPLITVLFFFSNILNLFLPSGMEISELAAILLGYSLFGGAYMAENIRGGLQSVRQGQFEASDALGLTTVQRTAFIVLPQALRVSIPNLVGQAIATFKETSLIAIIGGFDLLRVANQSIPSQPTFIGQNLPALLFISVLYWAVSYSMSRGSRNLEEKLGVGTR
jgi:His/Glu/Gln/Arg/opine family amino acid ABC transporter permease subunit